MRKTRTATHKLCLGYGDINTIETVKLKHPVNYAYLKSALQSLMGRRRGTVMILSRIGTGVLPLASNSSWERFKAH